MIVTVCIYRYSLCVSDDLILEFAKLYGGRDDSTPSNLTAEQRAILFTSMVVQPESLLLKVISIVFVLCFCMIKC